MPAINAFYVFAVLGPLFLLLALARCWKARSLVPQARVWFIVGVIFSVVALWLRLVHFQTT